MAGSGKAGKRDVEKGYPRKDFIAKLRRLADTLERDECFVIQVAGERVFIPRDAIVGVERERGGGVEELEFQMRWKTTRRRRRKANP